MHTKPLFTISFDMPYWSQLIIAYASSDGSVESVLAHVYTSSNGSGETRFRTTIGHLDCLWSVSTVLKMALCLCRLMNDFSIRTILCWLILILLTRDFPIIVLFIRV